MSLLTLNGIAFPLTHASAEPVRAGEVERSSNLGVRGGVRARAWNLHGATGLLPQDEARLVRQLVEGEGHVLSFDSTLTPNSYLWTSRGAVADTAVTPERRLRVPGRDGGGALRVLEDGRAVWRGVCESTEWTVLAWLSASDGAGWEQRAWRSDGSVWFGTEGPQGGYGQDAFVDEEGSLVLEDGSDSYVDWDEVVLVPYAAPDTWVRAWVDLHGGLRWPALPFVRAEGAAVPGGAREVQGQAGVLERHLVGPGRWAESFDFTLCSAS